MSTLKKDIIKLFSYAPTTEALEKNQVIFLTSIGMIVGDLPSDNDQQDPGTALTSVLLKHAREPYDDVELDGNDGYIQLTNARVLPLAGNPCNLGDIVIFPDQIIGVMLGSVK